MKIANRWNKLWIGLLLGILLPTLVLLGIYTVGYGGKYSLADFIRQTFMIQILTKMLCLCVVPNLAVFYFFLNREFWYATRGVILATLLCTLGIVIINFMF